jgi:hypothetical protein
VASNEYKAPSGGSCPPDGSRSPYRDSPLENKTHKYPKGQGDFKGRGGYPPSGHNTTRGGYKK